jgi:hypothetical protein
MRRLHCAFDPCICLRPPSAHGYPRHLALDYPSPLSGWDWTLTIVFYVIKNPELSPISSWAMPGTQLDAGVEWRSFLAPSHSLTFCPGATMITINTYYCPNCGKGAESADCKQSRNCLGLTKLTCQSCSCPVNLSGLSLILVGGMLGGFTATILTDGAGQIGLFYFALFSGLGLFRLLKQAIATKRNTEQSAAAHKGQS